MLIRKIASTSKSTTRLHPGGLVIQPWKTMEATCAPSSAADIVNPTIHDISVTKWRFHATDGRCRWSSSGQRRKRGEIGRFFGWASHFFPLFRLLVNAIFPTFPHFVEGNVPTFSWLCRPKLSTADSWQMNNAGDNPTLGKHTRKYRKRR